MREETPDRGAGFMVCHARKPTHCASLPSQSKDCLPHDVGFFIVRPSERVSFMPSPGELKTGYRQPASGDGLDSGTIMNRLKAYETD